MRRRMLAPFVVLLLPAHALAGCSGCNVADSSASLERIVTLADAAPVTFQIALGIPSQSCGFGCNFCGDPRTIMDLAFRTSWSGATAPGSEDAPVVRATLEQTRPRRRPPDALNPPLPLDIVVHDASVDQGQGAITATASCEGCDLTYTLTLARVDHAPQGTVTVGWSTDAVYNSRSGVFVEATP